MESVCGGGRLGVFCFCNDVVVFGTAKVTFSDLARRKSTLEKRREISHHGVAASPNDFIVFRVNNENCRELCNAVLLACFGMPVSVNLHAYKTISESYDRWVAESLLCKSH